MSLLRDAVALLGVACASWGFLDMYRPLGYIFVGGCLVAASYWWARTSADDRTS